MNQDLILAAYEQIGTTTPLKTDCGRLCGGACCKSSDAGDGMLLLPGEELLLPPEERERCCDAHLTGFGPVRLYVCADTCSREHRPFACRIFPLAPRLKDGAFTVRLDARGRPVCPLTQEPIQSLDPAFIRNVEAAFAVLARDGEYFDYLKALSRLVRRYANMSLDAL